MQLGQAHQIPRTTGMPCRWRSRRRRRQPARAAAGRGPVAVGLLQDALGQLEVALLAGGEVQLHRRVHQHGGGHAVMVAQLGDVDAAVGQGVQAQVADAAGRVEVTRLGEVAMHFEQAEDQVAVRPDVPRAHAGRAVPAHRLGRLRTHEAVSPGRRCRDSRRPPARRRGSRPRGAGSPAAPDRRCARRPWRRPPATCRRARRTSRLAFCGLHALPKISMAGLCSSTMKCERRPRAVGVQCVTEQAVECCVGHDHCLR